MLSFPRDPRRDNRLAPCPVPSRKILNRSEVPSLAVAGSLRNARRPQHKCRARWDLAGRKKIESLAARLGAAILSMIVAWIVPRSRNRGRPGLRRGALDTLYCGENNDFIAECERGDPIPSVQRARVSRSLSQLIRHLGDAGHGAFLVAFGT
jgi:hypothetical protein